MVNFTEVAVSTNAKVNLLDYDRQGVAAFFAERGEKPFRATQVTQWIHQAGVADFSAMSNLSKGLRALLAEQAEVRGPAPVSEQRSADGTRKWQLRLDDGNRIETVFIPEEGRGTLCISSQAGCALDCSFCCTAQQGFNRNLTTAEIVGQVWHARRCLAIDGDQQPAITNIVFMGMGEPLLNLSNVIKALNVLQDDLAYGLSKRRVTISTAGVVPALYRLAELSDVSLAVSLHAPDDALRDELVPLNRKYPIAELLRACRYYVHDGARRRVTFEYVMLRDVNDHPAQARDLAVLLRDMPAKVNLIPFNPFPGARFQRSTPEAIARFRDILLAAGLMTITRKTRGDDIAAACGQLAGQIIDRSKRTARLLAVRQASL